MSSGGVSCCSNSDPYMGVFRDRLEVLVELEPFGTLYRYTPLP